MLNALYKFNPMGANGAWQPYLGGGVGLANVDVATDDFGDFKQDTALAYQAIGGVAYNFSPQWSLLGEVRWFGTESGNYDGRGNSRFDAYVRHGRLARRRAVQLLSDSASAPRAVKAEQRRAGDSRAVRISGRRCRSAGRNGDAPCGRTAKPPAGWPGRPGLVG